MFIAECVIPQISCVSYHACWDNTVMRSRDSVFATQAYETRNGAGKGKVRLVIFNRIHLTLTEQIKRDRLIVVTHMY